MPYVIFVGYGSKEFEEEELEILRWFATGSAIAGTGTATVMISGAICNFVGYGSKEFEEEELEILRCFLKGRKVALRNDC